MMVDKKVALPAVGAGVLIAGGLAGRQLLNRWRKNPDPLGGRPVRFPDGEQRIVELADGAKINTVTIGEGPTIVCVHGLTASRHDWGPIAPALLEAGYQLVGVDQRGHGDSTAGTAGFGSEQLGRDLADVFDALDLHAVALVGHSMGGMAAMSYAANHLERSKNRVENLVLIATAASLDTARHKVGLLLGGVQIPDALNPPDRRLRIGAGLSVFGVRPSLHMVDEVIASFRRCDESVRHQATAALADHDVTGRLGLVQQPGLIIGGTRDLLITPPQIRSLAAHLPNAVERMLSGAGHMLIWERHVDIAELIVDFLGPSPDVAQEVVASSRVQ